MVRWRKHAVQVAGDAVRADGAIAARDAGAIAVGQLVAA